MKILKYTSFIGLFLSCNSFGAPACLIETGTDFGVSHTSVYKPGGVIIDGGELDALNGKVKAVAYSAEIDKFFVISSEEAWGKPNKFSVVGKDGKVGVSKIIPELPDHITKAQVIKPRGGEEVLFGVGYDLKAPDYFTIGKMFIVRKGGHAVVKVLESPPRTMVVGDGTVLLLMDSVFRIVNLATLGISGGTVYQTLGLSNNVYSGAFDGKNFIFGSFDRLELAKVADPLNPATWTISRIPHHGAYLGVMSTKDGKVMTTGAGLIGTTHVETFQRGAGDAYASVGLETFTGQLLADQGGQWQRVSFDSEGKVWLVGNPNQWESQLQRRELNLSSLETKAIDINGRKSLSIVACDN